MMIFTRLILGAVSLSLTASSTFTKAMAGGGYPPSRAASSAHLPVWQVLVSAKRLPHLSHPSGLAIDRRGESVKKWMYAVDTGNSRVVKFGTGGHYLGAWGARGTGPGRFQQPMGIAVDRSGDVYVADAGNDRVQKFTAEGEFLFAFGASGSGQGQFNRPSGVAVDNQGDIYVADWGNDRVQLFNPEGRYVEQFAGDATLSRVARDYLLPNAKPLRLREMANLEPQKRFKGPCSVRVDDQGRMYVADHGCHRIQVYQKEAYPLTAEQIKRFAAEYDPQPFHLDEAAAEASVFRGVAASGWHTAAVAMRLLVTGGLPFAGGIVGLGGEIAWPKPTRPGDILRVESEIIEITPSRSKPHQGIVTVRGTMFNQDREAVYVLTAKLLVPRRRAEK